MQALIAKYKISLEKTSHWIKPELGEIAKQLSAMSVYSGVPVYVVYAYYLDRYPEIEESYKKLLKFYQLEELD